MKKRCFILITALLLVLHTVAIAESSVPMGRFVENEIPRPTEEGYTFGLQLSEAGDLTVLGFEDQEITEYELSGEAWSKRRSFQNIEGFSEVARCQDTLYALYYPPQENVEFPSAEIGRYEKDGFIPLELSIDKSRMDKLGIAVDGTLLVQLYREAILIFNKENLTLEHRIDSLDGAFLVSGTTLFASSSSSKSIKQIDIKTGKISAEMGDAPITGEDLLAYDRESLYVANRGGVYRIAQGGVIWEQLVAGSFTSLSMSPIMFTSMAVKDGDIYITAYSDLGRYIFRYRYDESVGAIPRFELKVATLQANEQLTLATVMFQRQNPDYVVTVNVLLPEGTGITKDDAIRTLNTELLAGQGPDILMLDGMKISNYVDKNMLLDLGQMVADMNSKEELISELFIPLYQDDKIFAVPTSCALPVMISTEATTNDPLTLNEFVANTMNSEAESPIVWRTKQGYFTMFTASSYPSWFSRDGEFLEEMFEEYLNQIDSLYEKCGLNTHNGESGAQMLYSSALEGLGKSASVLNGEGTYYYDLLRVQERKSDVHPIVLGSFNKSMIETTMIGNMSGSISWMPGQAPFVYEPSGFLGVNARSADLNAAVEFVRVALSQEVQNPDTFGGLPVNKKSFEKKIQVDQSYFVVGTSITDIETGEETMVMGMWPNRGIRERISAMVREARTPYIPDTILLDMIRGELTQYFAGEMDAHTATQAVSAKVRGYLAE
ncbi:MAG: ABC transporter substrate-binding protein [Candidatus Limiplasma sp.]|nr:ABC transporter substrate-binding protein [Candidatus Limiplasma sp.]